MVSSLLAGIGVPLLVPSGRGRPDARVADPQDDARRSYLWVAGFSSERWPASNRNGGRLRVGTVAGIDRNDWPASLGICSALFTGIDIAANPVAMVNHRLRQCGLAGEAIQGNILMPPFADGSFDAIVAIGCLHHTGNLGGAFAACRRLLRPGGLFVCMVYYAYSYRRMWNEPGPMLRQFIRELCGNRGTIREGKTGAYDSAEDGSLAPSTDFVSIRSLRSLCDGFIDFRTRTENANQEAPFSRWTRDVLLSSPLPKVCGLDLYWSCIKTDRPS